MTAGPGDVPAATADEAHRRGCQRLLGLQHAQGHWEGEMEWNTTILSQYVLAHSVTGLRVPQDEHADIVQHYRTRRLADGGWGMHPASEHSSVYCTLLAYLALRHLGLAADHDLCAPARTWLRSRPGGARAVPTWGKFWLALTGVGRYEAMHPLPPELFLLPRWLPLHPDRFYCHTRSIMQSMAYLYGARVVRRTDDLTRSMREELFDGAVPGTAYRSRLGPDAVAPARLPLRALHAAMALYERRHSSLLRRRALRRCRIRAAHEHAVTDGLGLSPVNALLDILVLAHTQSNEIAGPALSHLEAWRWKDSDAGIRFAGGRSQVWDTAFALRALTAGGREPTPQSTDAVRRGQAFLRRAQLLRNVPRAAVTARSPTRGGWCFSEGTHAWPVSDCTAEAVHTLLETQDTADTVAAADFLLARQNRDGSFGSYEARRAPRGLEALNLAEMFTGCTVEGSYTECTGSALSAVVSLGRVDAGPDPAALLTARNKAARFLLAAQNHDGSWPAAWGVNRIYGTFFAVRGLRAHGLALDHPVLQQAANWIERVQRPDGGWGESWHGCATGTYVPAPTGQPVQTAWALLTLLSCGRVDSVAVHDAVRWLTDHQQPDGAWLQHDVTGVFFGTSMLHYRLYCEYFPLWALGLYLDARTPSQKRTTT